MPVTPQHFERVIWPEYDIRVTIRKDWQEWDLTHEHPGVRPEVHRAMVARAFTYQNGEYSKEYTHNRRFKYPHGAVTDPYNTSQTHTPVVSWKTKISVQPGANGFEVHHETAAGTTKSTFADAQPMLSHIDQIYRGYEMRPMVGSGPLPGTF